jgi:uncharacterized membrane protein
MKIETVIEIDKPPSEVYDFLMDEENLILWIKNFVRMEQLDGETRRVGSTSKHVYDENGRTVEYIEEIIINEENKLIEGILRNKSAEITITNSLKKTKKNYTQLTVTSKLHPKSFFYKIMTLFSKRKMINRQKEDIGRLKKAIEKLSKIE